MTDPWTTLLQRLDAARSSGRELDYDPQWFDVLPQPLWQRGRDELLARVAAGDAMAFEPAAQLGVIEALPALERYRKQGSPLQRAVAARALFRLRGDPLPAAPSNDPLRSGLDAYTLRSSDRPEAIPALLALLTAAGVHARVHAAESLVEKLGLAKLAEPRGSPLRTQMLGICSSLPSVWPVAAQALGGVLSAVQQGATAKALDLVYQPSPGVGTLDRFWSQATGWKPFDVGNILEMGRHDRAFADMVLITRLVGGDVNVLPAIRALQLPGWTHHVRAALPLVGKHPEIVRAYAAAIGEDTVALP